MGERTLSQLTLSVEIGDELALVVGGGAVARRKVATLLGGGARVRVVALALEPELERLGAACAIQVRIGPYREDDLEGVFLAVAASDCLETNGTVARDARQRGILVAVVNAPKLGNCTFPAVLKRGALEVAVTSGGRCPAFSALVRDYLAGVIGDEFGMALEQLAVDREKLLTEGKCSSYNAKLVREHAQRVIAALIDSKEPA